MARSMIDFDICLENTAHLQPPSSTVSCLQRFQINKLPFLNRITKNFTTRDIILKNFHYSFSLLLSYTSFPNLNHFSRKFRNFSNTKKKKKKLSNSYYLLLKEHEEFRSNFFRRPRNHFSLFNFRITNDRKNECVSLHCERQNGEQQDEKQEAIHRGPMTFRWSKSIRAWSRAAKQTNKSGWILFIYSAKKSLPPITCLVTRCNCSPRR